MPAARISQRISAIAESATSGRRCQGEGAEGGRPPRHRLRRRGARLPDPRLHRAGRHRGRQPAQVPPLLPGRRAAGAEAGHRGQDLPGFRLQGRGVPGAGHQRRQAGRVQHLRHAAGSGRRGHRPDAVLDHLPGGHPAGRRRAGGGLRRPGAGLPGHRGAARGRPHRPHQDPALRLPVQPHRRRVLAGAGQGDRPVGRCPRASGWSPTRSTST